MLDSFGPTINSVYALLDPITNEARYVGCTASPKQRYYAHLSSYRLKNSRVGVWIASLKAAGYKPVMVEIESGLNEDKAFESEFFWVAYLKGLGANLLNIRTTRGIYQYSGTPLPWRRLHGDSKAVRLYQDLVNNSQPF